MLMSKILLLMWLLAGCVSVVGPYCNRWVSETRIVNGGTQIKQVCKEWRRGA